MVEFTSDQIELRLDALHRVRAKWQPQRRRAYDVASGVTSKTGHGFRDTRLAEVA